MRLTRYKFFIILLAILLCMAFSAFPAKSAEVDPYIYEVIAKGAEEIAVIAFLKKNLFSSAGEREIEEERDQLAGELRYDCEHNMTLKFRGSYYARDLPTKYGNNLDIIKVCLFENYKGDPHNLDHPYYPADGSTYPGDFGMPPYVVVYDFISIEEALDLELSERDLPGDHQTYINYLMRRYPLFPGENVLDESSPETYIQIGGTGDALSKIDLVADSAISTSYTKYMKTALAKQRIPIPFAQGQITSLLGCYRERELYDLIRNYKHVTAQIQRAARLSVILPIFEKIWPQIEALGGILKENNTIRPYDPEGILPEEYQLGISSGYFGSFIPISNGWSDYSMPLGYGQPFSYGMWNFGYDHYKLSNWTNPSSVPFTETPAWKNLWESYLNPNTGGTLQGQVYRTVRGPSGKVYSWPEGKLLYGPPYL